MKLRRILLIFSAGFLLNASFALGAAGHAELVAAIPGVAEKLELAPEEVRLEFNEALLLIGDENPNRIEVIDSKGKLISGATSVSGPSARVELTAATGTITVRYRVVSGDGHLVAGEYQFTVAAESQVITETAKRSAETRLNFLIGLIWALLALSAVGIVALLRLRK